MVINRQKSVVWCVAPTAELRRWLVGSTGLPVSSIVKDLGMQHATSVKVQLPDRCAALHKAIATCSRASSLPLAGYQARAIIATKILPSFVYDTATRAVEQHALAKLTSALASCLLKGRPRWKDTQSALGLRGRVHRLLPACAILMHRLILFRRWRLKARCRGGEKPQLEAEVLQKLVFALPSCQQDQCEHPCV